ncbi:cob(I)yrinic acid a,c-diamide adenosyltransferase [Thiospirillum jenense]|uniref:Corrinoid adenosyltransferase n=1 Tax=Thiospirillum jenense TaxID=1653858 RepID=A0A839H9H9_9GAMM|nr:cob(I)yrinic acid a,c-diamide adenosyltransferase [Thiospirillum jenense]MBB1125150.1 cob(I)yrinic acid a,c-diamide adenosyltransferase [Thiospirillum jenense]
MTKPPSDPVDSVDADNAPPSRHQQRMQRYKAVVDKRLAQATITRGVVLVLTGTGKGKSSSAFGMVARALGHGLRVAVIQFIKGRGETGEEVFFRQSELVAYHVMGAGFTWETQDQARDRASAAAAWSVAAEYLRNPDYALVVLDELNIALKLQLLPLDDVLTSLAARPPAQHVIITGRAAPAALLDYADTVTEMRSVKHAYAAGIAAQIGIEL